MWIARASPLGRTPFKDKDNSSSAENWNLPVAPSVSIRTEERVYQIRFCKRFWWLRTLTIKRAIPIKRLRNGIFVKSNPKRFTEFTNCNLSQRLVELAPYFFFNDAEEHEFPSNFTKSYLKLGERFFSSVTWVLQLHTVWNQKDWHVDFAKLWTRESDSVYNHVSWGATNQW